MPRWPKKLVIGLGIAFAFVAIAEGASRLALGPEKFGDQSPIFEPDDIVGFRVAPNLRYGGFTTGNLGFRPARAVDDAKETILVLGDSMTLGTQVNDAETFCAKLESLEAARGRDVRVLNAGCSGYGPWEEAEALARILRTVKLQHVIVAFFCGNDFQDAGRESPAYRVIAGRLVSEKQYQSTSAPGRAFKNALAQLWSFGLVRVARGLGARGEMQQQQSLDAGPLGMDAPQIRAILELDDYFQAAQREPAIANGWRLMPRRFARIKELCVSAGASLRVAILPLPIVYDPDLRARLGVRWKVPPRSIDAHRPSNKIVDLLRSLGIDSIDLSHQLESHALGAKLHLPSDLHFSVEGHAAVAEILSQR
jgi:lysophospholipase L1-like esterase